LFRETINAITFQRFAAALVCGVRTQTYVMLMLQNAYLLRNVSNNSITYLATVRTYAVLSNYSLDCVPVTLRVQTVVTNTMESASRSSEVKISNNLWKRLF
jgi:hypothetical protein